jgi:ElaA protein
MQKFARPINWVFRSFYQLSLNELYQVFELRQEVFIVEQDCPYKDADGLDQKCFHLLGYCDNQIAAYARIVPAGVAYKEASIGRIVTSEKFRGIGLGKILMDESLAIMMKQFGNGQIRIMAQCYLKEFYREFAFVEDGQEFLEDGIPHIEMVRSAE